jgi:hypothetical protein
LTFCAAQETIDETNPDLEQLVRPEQIRPHLLGLGRPLVDDLVDRGLDEGAGDPRPASPALSIVGQRVGVVPQLLQQFDGEPADVHGQRPGSHRPPL